MTNKFYSLKGLRVVSINYDTNSCEFRFNGGVSLSIYNSYSLPSSEKKAKGTLIGMVVEDVLIGKENFQLIFDHSQELFDVDLRDSAFKGPEAMVLRMGSGSIVVWS